jgi:hypothetical protein
MIKDKCVIFFQKRELKKKVEMLKKNRQVMLNVEYGKDLEY